MKKKHKLESVLLRLGSIWNIITGAITLFYYSSWLQQNVLIEPVAANPSSLFTDRYYFQSIYLFVIGYGLVFILVGAMNFFLSTRLKQEKIPVKLIVWLSIWALISYLTVDVIGFVFYFATVIIFIVKNMAFKVAKNQYQ
ncbi:hypothetical protein [Gracilibacillus alcaliphilus]|uniref:hypothetical protein n=1 Tax=Gracilibacillus alcaliphilus TaxID=1401441 RepID=UPI00195B8DCE|nr:hypothetical protein [Gracilibacillus alcaliphilus]MBM7677684.1 Na+-transporting methylmalonyl-CoA/oxaloacetate decarboxylase gamma subunit [Gracilibacillus alcaliphilus]